jgi:hypothetical protein
MNTNDNLEHGHLRHLGGVDVPKSKRQNRTRWLIIGAAIFYAILVLIFWWQTALGQDSTPIPPQGISPAESFPAIQRELTIQCDAMGGGLVWLVRDGGDVVYYWCLKFPPKVNPTRAHFFDAVPLHEKFSRREWAEQHGFWLERCTELKGEPLVDRVSDPPFVHFWCLVRAANQSA